MFLMWPDRLRLSKGADSIGHGGTCPHFYKWMGTGDTVSRRTANKKLTKRYWPSRKRSTKPKSGGARQKIFWRRAPGVWPHPTLSNSFRRQWVCQTGKVVDTTTTYKTTPRALRSLRHIHNDVSHSQRHFNDNANSIGNRSFQFTQTMNWRTRICLSNSKTQTAHHH